MGANHRSHGIYQTGPSHFLVQARFKGRRRTRRIRGALPDAKASYARMVLELQEEHRAALQNVQEASTTGLPAPYSSYRSPTLAEWLTNRYAEWQKRAQNESTRRKLDSPKRYLLASDLGDLPLREIDTASVNAYVEWRLEVGTLTFATRKDGKAFRPRAKSVGAQTINKSLKLLSAALRLAHDEELLGKLPKINYLPEDDARAILPPTEEQFRAMIRGAEQLRAIAPLLPEVIELLGEFGLRPGELFHLTWASVDWTMGVGENQGAIRVEEQKRTRVVGGRAWVPKNKKFRFIPFSVRGREILERLYAAAKPMPSDLVIPNDGGLPYIRLDEGEKKGGGAGVWKRLREISGVPGVSMRDLRHYFAVQNLVSGVPLAIVSAWMGHSSVQLTVKRYGRWAHDAKEQWPWAALRGKPLKDVAQTRREIQLVR
jgi:integrase